MKDSKWNAKEWEMAINVKAMRLSYVVLELCLTIYCIYKLIVDGRLPFVSIFWLVSCGVFFIAKLVYTKKVIHALDDPKE